LKSLGIRVLAIDRGSAYFAGLVEELTPENGVDLIGRLKDASGLAAYSAQAPEVIVIDVEPGADGTGEYLRSIPDFFPDAHIFLVTPPEDLETLRQAQRRPVIGIVAPEADPRDVIAAIRHASGSAILLHRDFAPGSARQLLPYFPQRTPDGGTSPLTPRETEVLTMLSQGTHVDGIARTLRLSVHTVRGHVKNILAKLDSHSQLEAVAKAKMRGWVSDLS
jgi:DNA-binding NarL/FixJ family response regulator